VSIDPLTRIEGHLKIEAVVENGEVKEAHSSGTLFRGFEIILQGRDPRDAQRITQRVCGVCPAAHATAAALNLDSAFGIADRVPDNGRLIRNLILGSNYLQSHILHFYHLAALDFVDVTAVADYEGDDPNLNSLKRFLARGELGPFVPRYEGDYRLSPKANREAVAHYVQALEMRRKAHEMLAIFGGKMPHNMGIMPGGVTENPTVDKITAFLWRLNELHTFIDQVYIPDILALAQAYPDYWEIGAGCGNLLSYGVFDLEGKEPDLTKRQRFYQQGTVSRHLQPGDLVPDQITEYVRHSWFSEETSGQHPSQSETLPRPGKPEGYSWIKAPRYNGQVYEVGPLARILVSYAKGNERVKELVDGVLSAVGATPQALFSVLGRHAARALDCKLVAEAMAEWVLALKPGEPVCADYEVPEEAQGMGLVEAPRGALGHWMEIREGKIAYYQLVVSTSWNASPQDDQGQPGPIEQAIIGTKVRDEANPFEIVRIVRSFDPCLACAVHVMTPQGNTLGKYRVA